VASAVRERCHRRIAMEKLLSMLAESPIHAGTGAELGYVDLPIQRERATGLPTIHGSGVKGAIRDIAGRSPKLDSKVVVELFGSEPPSGPGGAALEPGALVFTDARLLLLPCRTAGPAFAWVTSPMALARLRRDATEAGLPQPPPEIGSGLADDRALVADQQSAYSGSEVFVEEFRFARVAEPSVTDWAIFIRDHLLPADQVYEFWRVQATRALVVVSDDNFRDFAMHGTEVVTRVRLDPIRKTVVEGALWTEEYLPQDSLLYSLVAATVRTDHAVQVFGHLNTILGTHPVIQFGGKETIGRGLVRLRLVP